MKNIFKIFKISKPLHHLVAWICFLIVITAVIAQLSPILSKYVVDEIVLKVQGQDADLNKIYLLIGIIFGVSLIEIILSSISERLGDHFGGRLRKFLTERFYDKVFRLPQEYYDTELSGKIINQLNRGIDSIRGFINTATNFIIPTFLQTILTIIILSYYNWQTALFTTILFPIYLSLSYYSSKKWGEIEVEKNKFEDIGRGRIQEVISNIKLVKSFGNSLNEYKFISNNLTKINDLYAEQSNAFHIFDFLRNLSLNIILLLVNVVVFYNAYQGLLTIGEVLLIIQLVNQARRPLFAMSFILTQIQHAESGSKEFFEILELESKEDYRLKSNDLILKNPSLEFDNVTFKYKTSENVLNNVSFKINPNEKVALVGHSGAGKSTIINLILKFYDPSNGRILIGDKDYAKLDHNYVREHISLVFQENELFSTTIKENVKYGSSGSTDEDIIKALKLANAYDFVSKLPKGIDSEVGERGVRLSGGQKQRIQIARAILHDEPILILDEATSSLDSKSEKEVQEGLENLMKNKLVIIIAHRFSTIQNVDKIFVINDGTIVDSGTPKELSTRGGIYSDLLRYQIDGNKKLLESYELY